MNVIVVLFGVICMVGFVLVDGGMIVFDCVFVWCDDELEVMCYLVFMCKFGYVDWGDYFEFLFGGFDYVLWYVFCDEYVFDFGCYVIVYFGVWMVLWCWLVECFVFVVW